MIFVEQANQHVMEYYISTFTDVAEEDKRQHEQCVMFMLKGSNHIFKESILESSCEKVIFTRVPMYKIYFKRTTSLNFPTTSDVFTMSRSQLKASSTLSSSQLLRITDHCVKPV